MTARFTSNLQIRAVIDRAYECLREISQKIGNDFRGGFRKSQRLVPPHRHREIAVPAASGAIPYPGTHESTRKCSFIVVSARDVAVCQTFCPDISLTFSVMTDIAFAVQQVHRRKHDCVEPRYRNRYSLEERFSLPAKHLHRPFLEGGGEPIFVDDGWSRVDYPGSPTWRSTAPVLSYNPDSGPAISRVRRSVARIPAAPAIRELRRTIAFASFR